MTDLRAKLDRQWEKWQAARTAAYRMPDELVRRPTIDEATRRLRELQARYEALDHADGAEAGACR